MRFKLWMFVTQTYGKCKAVLYKTKHRSLTEERTIQHQYSISLILLLIAADLKNEFH